MQSPSLQPQQHALDGAQSDRNGSGSTELSPRDYWLNALRPRLALLETSRGSLAAYRSRREVTKAIVERELDGISQAIAMLRFSQNAVSAPVHALPDELLSTIFEYTLPVSTADKEDLREGRLAFTHVCHCWRSVALDCVGLWTQIPHNAGEEWMHAFLARSGTATISISNGYNSSWPPYMSLITPHVHRLAELGLQASRREQVEMFLDCARSCAPRLQKARMAVMPFFADKLGPTYLVLPDDFLKRAPALEELRLEEFTLKWTSLQWTHLRLLNLHAHHRRDYSQADSFEIVLQCLRSATQLEELYLEHCLPETPILSQTDADQISLGRVRYLALKDDARRCLALWKALELPSTAVVHICAQDRDASQVDFKLAALLLHRHLCRAGGKPLRYLRLRVDQHALELRGWHDKNTHSANGIPRDMAHGFSGEYGFPHRIGGRLDECPSIYINVPSLYNREPTTGDAIALLAACPYDHLEAFSVMEMKDCRWFQPSWAEMLPSAEHLTRLYIAGRTLTDTFCVERLSATGEDTGVTYLPQLRELHLESVKLMNNTLAGMASELALLEVIRRTPSLESLALSMCDVREKDLEPLKELVEVKCYGIGLVHM